MSDDPRTLDLAELRARRAALQEEDDVVSYVRRIAQARLDLVAVRDASGEITGDITGELPRVLSQQLVGGAARPPRPDAVPLDRHPLVDELEALCTEYGFSRLEQLDDAGRAALTAALEGFEERVSADRRARHVALDALSAELVRRYRDGEASIDTLGGGAGDAAEY